MSTVERVTLSLPADTVRELDAFATAQRRSRSNAAAILLDRYLAAETSRQREPELPAIHQGGGPAAERAAAQTGDAP